MDTVEIKNLKKAFKHTEALKGISFSISQGEIFGLLGPNGAGKTTTVNILAGLLEKDSGSIKILGKEPSEVKDMMNITSTDTWLPAMMTVYQNLRVYGMLYGVKGLDERISYLLELFRITDLKNRRFGNLSAGQKARVMLCKGLLNSPKVLLLDEATVGLDPDIAQQTRAVIKKLKDHTAILLTSHNMYEVEEMCDRIAILDKGKILTIGTTKQIKSMMKKKTLEEVFIKIAREGYEMV